MPSKHSSKPPGAWTVLPPEGGKGPEWAECVIDPEAGNRCVQRFMRFFRLKQGLTLHRVAALTGIDRAYLRRVERQCIHLSLVVLWRWCNGLHLKVDWVLRVARRREEERLAAKRRVTAQGGGD
jgi:hypothetical protein